MRRNILVSHTDQRAAVDGAGNFRPAFHIVERDGYTPIEGGYRDTVFTRDLTGHEVALRVSAAIDYARNQGIPVQVNHAGVRTVLHNLDVDTRGIEMVPGPGDEAP
nr:hypothetical protein [Methanoculleus marisnigri]